MTKTDSIKETEKVVGYIFKDKTLLGTALTHSSYANEYRIKNNERLEFLGDSVLSIIISEYLFRTVKDINEGDLTKFRATLVCEQSLYEVSKKISLGSLIRLGRGEERNGGRERASIVSDAFEALLAAIYLDAGFETAKKWLLDIMEDSIKDVLAGKRYGDYKTMLQEAVQRGSVGKVTYAVIGESGQDHNKTFEVEVFIDGEPKGEGTGSNKKEAEQNAAHYALDNLRN